MVIGSITLIAVATLAAVSRSPSETQGDENAFERSIAEYHDLGLFDGAVSVVRDGEIVYTGAFGTADRTWGIPNQPDTRFHIASITKQFTALLVMQLADEQSIRLDETIDTYLPWYREDTASRITVRHLLQHMSGIPEPITEFDQIDDALAVTADPRSLIEKFASGDLLFDPGTTFNYSNSDYFLLGAIIEAQTGMTFAEVLQERVLEPLGMESTGMRRFETVVPKMATGYQRTDGVPEHRLHFGQLAYAAAGMYSTVEDLAKWNIALLENTLLSEERTEEMFTPVILDGQGSFVALGSWVYNRPLDTLIPKAPRLVERRGYIMPFTALTVLCPDDMHAFVILSNLDPCDIHRLPFAQGLPLDILLQLYGERPLGPQQSDP